MPGSHLVLGPCSQNSPVLSPYPTPTYLCHRHQSLETSNKTPTRSLHKGCDGFRLQRAQVSPLKKGSILGIWVPLMVDSHLALGPHSQNDLIFSPYPTSTYIHHQHTLQSRETSKKTSTGWPLHKGRDSVMVQRAWVIPSKKGSVLGIWVRHIIGSHLALGPRSQNDPVLGPQATNTLLRTQRRR